METPELIERAHDLIEAGNWPGLSQTMADWHPADIAEVIAQCSDKDQVRIYALVDEERRPDVLAELESDTASAIIEALSTTELSAILEDMSPDDAADVIGELPEERSAEVLALMEEEESKDVRKLLEYPEDSAGGIMTTDVVSMTENQTVAEALEAIADMETGEKFYVANIIDGQGVLTGYVDLWDLLRERNRQRRIGELAKRKFIAAKADMDQEEVAQLMHKYDMQVIPVIDDAGRLVGRITTDDVLDVLEEEASEDIFRLAGSDDAELETTSSWRRCFVRLPWLLITLGGGFFTSLILKYFHEHISGMIILGVFVPVVLAMGGNTGIQSSTLIIRSIALGSASSRRIMPLLLKEISTGAIMGCICGAVVGGWAQFLIRHSPAAPGMPGPMQMAAVVALAMFASMTFAAVSGALVPILLDRNNVDPAVASGPFVTILNDISALLIYYGVTVGLLFMLG